MNITRLSETVLREAQEAGANIYQIQSGPQQQEQVKFRLVYPAFPGCNQDPSIHDKLVNTANKINGVQLEYFDMMMMEESYNGRSNAGSLKVPGKLYKDSKLDNIDKRVTQMDAWGITPWGERAVLLDANNNRIGTYVWSDPNFEQNVRNAINQYQQPAQSRSR